MEDYIALAVRSLYIRKLRSFLTIIGIVIGIMSIVALVSVGNGLQYAVTEQFEKIGTNRVYVFAGGFGDPGTRSGLTEKDVETLNTLAEVDYITPYLNKQVEVAFGNEEYVKAAFGFPTENMKQAFEDFDVQLSGGRFFNRQEKGSVIIGSKVAENFFDKELRLGNQLLLNGEKLKIVGILAPIGSPDDDNAIYVPMDKFRDITDDKESVTIIEVVLKDGVDVQDVVKKMEHTLERARNDDLFDISTPDQILETFGSILTVINVILVAIASISLLVGAIGILNSMYTSVVERTKEIGIMKSLGAKNGTILGIFLLESAIIAIIGGVLGVTLGSLIALGVGAAAKASGFTLILIRIDPGLIIFSLLFAGIVGVGSGYLPARQAAAMVPVEAMRK